MISPIFLALLVYVIFSFLFYIMYFYIRPRINKGEIFRKLFLINMFYGIFMVFIIPYTGLKYYGIDNFGLNISLVIMAFGIIIHHLSLLEMKINNKKIFIQEIHGPISHILVYIPFVVAGMFGAISFSPRIQTNFDLIIFLIWFVETEILGVIGILVGLNVIKLPYK